jgi:molybdate transport system substrate-binding protein
VARIGYIPIAVSVFSKQRPLAQQFIDFLVGEEGQAVFRKWHYLTSVEEARKLARPETPVGGEWKLPAGW